jgi:hypothetical protein
LTDINKIKKYANKANGRNYDMNKVTIKKKEWNEWSIWYELTMYLKKTCKFSLSVVVNKKSSE